MNTISKLWNRLPVILKAILTGFTILLAGNLPWSVLLILNTKVLPVVPWSSIIMIFYLWLFYKYLGGKWKPDKTSSIRKEYLRGVNLSPIIMAWSLLAGFTGLLSLSFFFKLYVQVVDLKLQSPLPDISQFNPLFIGSSIIMISIVAGVVEEAAFRGYMQVPMEKKYGPVFAIIIVGLMFGLAHFTQPNMSLLMMPLFIVSSVIYGLLAYTSKSIIPCIILHSFGDALELMLIWLAGMTLTSEIKEQFIIIVLAVVFLAASIITFKKLQFEMKRNLSTK